MTIEKLLYNMALASILKEAGPNAIWAEFRSKLKAHEKTETPADEKQESPKFQALEKLMGTEKHAGVLGNVLKGFRGQLAGGVVGGLGGTLAGSLPGTIAGIALGSGLGAYADHHRRKGTLHREQKEQPLTPAAAEALKRFQANPHIKPDLSHLSRAEIQAFHTHHYAMGGE